MDRGTVIKKSGGRRVATKAGRPSLDEAAEITRAILDAATECFLANGIEASSMEAIAAKTGVPRSTLYRRFPDKASLLQALVKDRMQAWTATQPLQNWNLAEDLEGRLRQYAVNFLTSAVSSEIMTFRRLAAGPGEAAAKVARLMRDVGRGEITDLIEREIATYGPEIGAAAKNPRLVATALCATLSDWLASREPDGQFDEADAVIFANSAVDLIVNGKAAW